MLATTAPTPVTVNRLMEWPVATVDSDATLAAVAQALAEYEVGALAVMDDDTLVGVISERDLVVHLAQGANLEHVTAAEVMATELVTVAPTATVVEAARLMIESGVRHLPVLADDDLVGFLSVRAVVEALAARD
ncbi:MAG TPA: CBS domain-containing protein [Marmoricola sp.]|nr:CBS domain-containing protein [Marmoricola sp.]